MNVIIVGAGKVGYSIAHHLAEEVDTTVTMIDKKKEVLDKIQESVDVMFVKGNGLSAKVLHEANIRTADLIICVTNSDETNILCCLTAKKLGAKYTIARVRDPEYALELYRFRKDLGLDLIINPEQQAALEISRLLHFPTADGIETFMNGRMEMVSFRVPETNKLANRSVSQVFAKNKFSVLLAAIERDNEVFIPKGDIMLRKNDLVRVLGRPDSIVDFFRETGILTAKIKDAMIIGGGKITFYLSQLLNNKNIDLKIIEIDRKKCEELSEYFPKALIIQGDGTDEELLSSEDISEMGAVVCLTDKDEENVVVALHARSCGVPKTIVKINHINLNMVKKLGLGSVVCPKNITAYQIIRYVRGLKNSLDSEIQTMYKLIDKEETIVEALEFNVHGSSECIGKELKDLHIKKNVLVGCIGRGHQINIATGNSVIHIGDTVVIIAENQNIDSLDDILADVEQ